MPGKKLCPNGAIHTNAFIYSYKKLEAALKDKAIIHNDGLKEYLQNRKEAAKNKPAPLLNTARNWEPNGKPKQKQKIASGTLYQLKPFLTSVQ